MTATLIPEGPLAVHVIEDPFRADRRRSRLVPYRRGLTPRALADLELGFDVSAAAFLPGRGGRLGAVVEPGEMDDVLLEPNEIVHLVAIPEGAEISLATIITNLLVNAAVAVVSSLLFPPPDPPTQVEADTSLTYGWNGIRTNYKAAGAVLPLVLGKHAVGGVVISQEVRSVTSEINTLALDGTEVYRILLAVCRGPIQSIGGITADADGLTGGSLPAGLKINGQSADLIEGLRAWVRLGSLDQSPIDDFDTVSTIYEVNLEVANFDDNGVAITDFSEAISFDMPEAGDYARVTIRWPFGLYSNGGSGAASTVLSIRYQELSSSGVPFGPTVTLDDVVSIAASETSAFTQTVRIPLYDPSTFTTGSISAIAPRIAGTSFARTNAEISFAGGGIDKTIAAPVSFAAWYRGAKEIEDDDTGLNQPFLTGPVFSISTGPIPTVENPLNPNLFAGFKGIAIYHVAETRDVVSIGDGTSVESIQVDLAPFQTATFYAIVFEPGAGTGGQNVLRVYRNGGLFEERLTSVDLVLPGGDSEVYFWDNKAGAYSGPDCKIDRFQAWEKAIPAGSIGTAWLQTDPSLIEDQAVALDISFDDLALISGTTYSFGDLGPFSNGGQLFNTQGAVGFFTPDPFFPGFTVPASPSNTLKRGRYRISVQRETNEQESSTTKGTTFFHTLGVEIARRFAYPETALLGLEIPAQELANGRDPDVLVPVEGLLLDIWDGNSATSPGFFKGFTETPWRQLPSLFLDERALGPFHEVTDFDWAQVEEAADYAEELVTDGTPKVLPTALDSGAPADYTPDTSLFSTGWFSCKVATTDLPDTWAVGSSIRFEGFGGLVVAGWPSDGTTATIAALTFETDGWVAYFEVPDFAIAGTASPVVPPLARLERREQRHRCGIVFDRADENVWDAISRIARAGRGAVVPYGSRISFLVQKEEAPVHIFNESNIVRESLTIAGISPEDDYNSATAEILNEALDYERDPVQRQNEELKNATDGVREIRKSFRFEGVTSISQAARELDVLLAQNLKLRSTISFETWLDAIALRPGDVFYFANRLPRWDYGGRIKSDTGDAAIVQLDLDVVLEAGKTYIVAVEASDGTISEATVSSPAGSYAAGDAISLATSLAHEPLAGQLWVLGKETTSTRLFRCVKVSLAQDFRRKVEAVEYDATVYDATGFSQEALFASGSQDVTPPTLGGPAIISSVTASEVNTFESGVPTYGVRVGWEVPEEQVSRAVAFRIYARPLPRAQYDIPNEVDRNRIPWRLVRETDGTSRSIRITGDDVVVGAPLEVSVVAVSRSGQTSRPNSGTRRIVSVLGFLPQRNSKSALAVARYGGRLRIAGAGLNETGGLEVRQGGWILGMPIASEAGGSATAFVDEFADGNDNAAGDGSVLMIGRDRLASGQFASDQVKTFSTNELHEDDAQADVIAVRQEDFGFSSVPTGGTGAPALSGLVESDGVVSIDPASSSLAPSWTSSVFDLTNVGRYRVNFAVEAWQIHPATAQDFEDKPGDGWWAENWTGEGPLRTWFGYRYAPNMVPQYQIRLSTTSSPTASSWEPYRPGVYFGRSFQLRIVLRRFDDTFSASFDKASIRIYREPKRDPGDFDAGTF